MAQNLSLKLYCLGIRDAQKICNNGGFNNLQRVVYTLDHWHIETLRWTEVLSSINHQAIKDFYYESVEELREN